MNLRAWWRHSLTVRAACVLGGSVAGIAFVTGLGRLELLDVGVVEAVKATLLGVVGLAIPALGIGLRRALGGEP